MSEVVCTAIGCPYGERSAGRYEAEEERRSIAAAREPGAKHAASRKSLLRPTDVPADTGVTRSYSSSMRNQPWRHVNASTEQARIIPAPAMGDRPQMVSAVHTALPRVTKDSNRDRRRFRLDSFVEIGRNNA